MQQHIDIYENKNQVMADALERVVMELYMKKEQDQCKMITFCGSEPGVGTTSIAIDVAIFMAKSGWKTLLVDADLHKSIEYKTLSSKSTFGLADYLEGRCPIDRNTMTTNEENLFFLPSGVAYGRPLPLFCSEQLNHLLEQLNQEYEYVIFDAPAINSSTDTCVLASKVDGTVLITAYGISSTNILKSNLEIIHKYNINLLGVILNRSDRELYRSYTRDYDYFNKMKYRKDVKRSINFRPLQKINGGN